MPFRNFCSSRPYPLTGPDPEMGERGRKQGGKTTDGCGVCGAFAFLIIKMVRFGSYFGYFNKVGWGIWTDTLCLYSMKYNWGGGTYLAKTRGHTPPSASPSLPLPDPALLVFNIVSMRIAFITLLWWTDALFDLTETLVCFLQPSRPHSLSFTHWKRGGNETLHSQLPPVTHWSGSGSFSPSCKCILIEVFDNRWDYRV